MDSPLARARSHPLVRLRHERICERAYAQSQADPTRSALDNWLSAEDDETRFVLATWFGIATTHPRLAAHTFDEHYEALVSWSDDLANPSTGHTERLGTKEPRRCSICQHTRPKVSFRSVAHLLPELLGSGALITWDECDACNARAGRDYENDLGNMLLPERALFGTPAKGGAPKLKFDKGPSVGGRSGSNALLVTTKEGDGRIRSTMTGPHSFVLDLHSPRFRPRRVLKALAKITWQALPLELRSEAEALRRYVNEEIDWPDVCFFRGCIPGLSRVALGLWRRRPDAPTDLPELVTLVSTSGTVLIWACPDLASGQQLPVLVPRLPCLPGTNPELTKVTVRNDEYVRPGWRRFEYQCTATTLAYTHEPKPVRVLVGEDIELDATLTTPRGALGADLGEITYELRSPSFIGALYVDRSVARDEYQLGYRFDVAPSARFDDACTRRVLAALGTGASVRIVTSDPEAHELFHTRGSSDASALPAHLDLGLAVAQQLALLREAFDDVTPSFPSELDDDDLWLLQFLAGAVEHGYVRVRLPGEQDLTVTREQGHALVQRARRGPFTLSGDQGEPWILWGVTYDVGGGHAHLEQARLLDDPEIAEAALAGLAPSATTTLTVAFESIVYEFPRFVKPR